MQRVKIPYNQYELCNIIPPLRCFDSVLRQAGYYSVAAMLCPKRQHSNQGNHGSNVRLYSSKSSDDDTLHSVAVAITVLIVSVSVRSCRFALPASLGMYLAVRLGLASSRFVSCVHSTSARLTPLTGRHTSWFVLARGRPGRSTYNCRVSSQRSQRSQRSQANPREPC